MRLLGECETATYVLQKHNENTHLKTKQTTYIKLNMLQLNHLLHNVWVVVSLITIDYTRFLTYDKCDYL